MTHTITILPKSEDDIAEMLEQYDSVRPGLAARIVQELEAIFQHVSELPFSYAGDDDNRHINLQTVPFQVFYAVRDMRVIILGCVASRMEPNAKFGLIERRRREQR